MFLISMMAMRSSCHTNATCELHTSACQLSAIHLPGAMGKNDVSNFNAVFNLDTDQLTTLTRRANGYEGFVLEFIIVEAL